MALQFNPYLTSGSGGMVERLRYVLTNSSNCQLWVYPTTVTMPSVAPAGTPSLPAGAILIYTINNGFQVLQNSIVTSTSLTATASATGTVAWFALYYSTASSSSGFISDSISAPGDGGILELSTLTPMSGQSVTATVELKLIG